MGIVALSLCPTPQMRSWPAFSGLAALALEQLLVTTGQVTGKNLSKTPSTSPYNTDKVLDMPLKIVFLIKILFHIPFYHTFPLLSHPHSPVQ